MKWIEVTWNVYSKMTGQSVEFGTRSLLLIGRLGAKEHLNRIKSQLLKDWSKCAYDVFLSWKYVEATDGKAAKM